MYVGDSGYPERLSHCFWQDCCGVNLQSWKPVTAQHKLKIIAYLLHSVLVSVSLRICAAWQASPKLCDFHVLQAHCLYCAPQTCSWAFLVLLVRCRQDMFLLQDFTTFCGNLEEFCVFNHKMITPREITFPTTFCGALNVIELSVLNAVK